jgi:hypothetical protein
MVLAQLNLRGMYLPHLALALKKSPNNFAGMDGIFFRLLQEKTTLHLHNPRVTPKHAIFLTHLIFLYYLLYLYVSYPDRNELLYIIYHSNKNVGR